MYLEGQRLLHLFLEATQNFAVFCIIWEFNMYTNLKVLYCHFCSLVDYDNQLKVEQRN